MKLNYDFDNPQSKFSKAQVKQIYRDYINAVHGKGLTKIAKHYGVHKSTIFRIVNNLRGAEKKVTKNNNVSFSYRNKQVERNKKATIYYLEGMTMLQISKKLKISVPVAWKAVWNTVNDLRKKSRNQLKLADKK